MPCAYDHGGRQPEAGHSGSSRKVRADSWQPGGTVSHPRDPPKSGTPTEKDELYQVGQQAGLADPGCRCEEFARSVFIVASGWWQLCIFRDYASGGKFGLWKVSSSLPLRGIYERFAYRSQKAG